MLSALMPGKGEQLVKARFQAQQSFLWYYRLAIRHPPFSMLVRFAEKGNQFAAPLVAGILSVGCQIAYQMYVAFRMACSKVVQGCLVVMCQDAREFLHERNLCQRFDVLPLHGNIEHPMLIAEIADIGLMPVQAHCCRVCAHLRQVEQLIFDLFRLYSQIKGNGIITTG